MIRTVFTLAILLSGFTPRGSAASALPPTTPRATVYSISDPSALSHFDENTNITREMTDHLILAVTQQRDIVQAWRALVDPASDRIGIKLSTTGGRFLSSHRGVVDSILRGLDRAGVPRSRILLWDRDAADLDAAGFGEYRNAGIARAINPPHGFDAAEKLVAPVLGKLIWGDLLFQGRRTTFRRGNDDENGLSTESHLPTILTREVTKIINVAVLADQPGCGVAGAFYNVTVTNLDNNRRFSQPQGASSIPDLYMDARIGPKIVLNILDGLVAQYAAGPSFDPNYAFAHNTLYASKDAVALDATALRLMEKWRLQSKLPPIGKRASWLQEAEELGIGYASEEKIDIKPVSLATETLKASEVSR